MFQVGDIVRIYPHNDTMCWPDSPVLNLKNSLAKIKTVNKPYSWSNHHYYTLEFIELDIKKPEKYEESQAKLHWQDDHLVLVEEYKEFQDIDTMELFMS